MGRQKTPFRFEECQPSYRDGWARLALFVYWFVIRQPQYGDRYVGSNAVANAVGMYLNHRRNIGQAG